jgi:hypothetical protein
MQSCLLYDWVDKRVLELMRKVAGDYRTIEQHRNLWRNKVRDRL